MMIPTVTILTYCAHPLLAYGTLLVFETLRIGFPTARIEVFDNASHPQVRPLIAEAARKVGATFHALEPLHYADHYRWLLMRSPFESLVILDPDVVFWRRVEGWTFDDQTLAAGRLIPQLHSRPRSVCLPRLHPSLLWVPNVQGLREQVERAERRALASDLIAQRSVFLGGNAYFFDTLAGLYHALPDRCRAFGEAELDSYDHLFYGSHYPVMAAGYDGGFDTIRRAHKAAATGDIASLRGIWREQQRYFEDDLSTRPDGAFDLDGSLAEVQGWRDSAYARSELREATSAMLTRIVQGIGRLL